MSQFLRANIRGMHGYVPGEQPRDGSIIKLNSNENPYPPSPRVLEAIQASVTGDRLRKYPDGLGRHFCQVAGRLLGADPDGILIGNGSDDILTIITRAFVPEGGLIVAPTPSYLLYRCLAELQGARYHEVPFTADWHLPVPWPQREASLTFLANPNSPSGTSVSRAELEALADSLAGPLVVDEAYVDFAEAHCLRLADRPNVLISRSLSKSYSLAGIRFGYAVANPPLVRQLLKVKDSFNCDVLSLAAAAAALEDQDYLLATRKRILATRARLAKALVKMGFAISPSQSNFIWCRHSDHNHSRFYEELKRRQILIRYMNYPGYGDGLRISIGTDAEIDRFLEELASLI
jgi:histidinol-phosphate aminotransferase